MSNFRNSIEKFITCEIRYKNSSGVNCLAKLNNGNWVAVKKDGSLDWVEIDPRDFRSILETVEATGAEVRFTNHSAV